MTNINRFSPHGIKAITSVLEAGTGDLEGGRLMGIMLNDTTVVDDQWDTHPTLDLFTPFGEYAGASYVRKVLANPQITITGTKVLIAFDQVVYNVLGSAGTLEHFLIYMETATAVATDPDPGLTLRVPIALMDLTQQPDGGQYLVDPPLLGFSYLETN